MKRSPEIYAVGGFSAYKNWMRFGLQNCWRKSKYFSAWGWGTSRMIWNKYQLHLPSNRRQMLQQSVVWNKLGKGKDLTWLGRFAKVDTDSPKTWDFQMQFLMFRDGGHLLLPTARLSDNEGFNNNWSTHTTGDRPRWMLKTGTSLSVPKPSISKISKLYELGDSVTIGSDNRFFTGVSVFISRMTKIPKTKE